MPSPSYLLSPPPCGGVLGGHLSVKAEPKREIVFFDARFRGPMLSPPPPALALPRKGGGNKKVSTSKGVTEKQTEPTLNSPEVALPKNLDWTEHSGRSPGWGAVFSKSAGNLWVKNEGCRLLGLARSFFL